MLIIAEEGPVLDGPRGQMAFVMVAMVAGTCAARRGGVGWGGAGRGRGRAHVARVRLCAREGGSPGGSLVVLAAAAAVSSMHWTLVAA